MSGISCKDVYLEEGRRVLEANILPEKYCNFDCIFCPIGRSGHKSDAPVDFGDAGTALAEFGEAIARTRPDLVFINSKGEALLHARIREFIALAKGGGLPVRLLSNGYLLNDERYRDIANGCEEVTGELKAVTEEHFQRLQRPIAGYTLEKYVSGMEAFRRQYGGKFLLEITIIRGYDDGGEAVSALKDAIRRLAPDRLTVVRLEEERFRRSLRVDDESFSAISRELAGEAGPGAS